MLSYFLLIRISFISILPDCKLLIVNCKYDALHSSSILVTWNIYDTNDCRTFHLLISLITTERSQIFLLERQKGRQIKCGHLRGLF